MTEAPSECHPLLILSKVGVEPHDGPDYWSIINRPIYVSDKS